MKKFFTLAMAIMASASITAVAQSSYSIVFHGNDSTDFTSIALNNSNFLTAKGVMESGAENISSVNVSKTYLAEANYGLKLNTNSKIGSITINLAENAQVNATKIVVGACVYDDDWQQGKATTLTLDTQECPDTLEGLNTNGRNQVIFPTYEFPLNGKKISAFTIKTSSKVRVNIKSIEVFYEATSAEQTVASKEVASVKYYNLAGVESATGFSGINIKVTTYTDGTKEAVKVIK